VYTERIRSQFGPLLAGSVAALCLLAAVVVAAEEGASTLLTVWPWLAIVACLAWALYWRPEVRVTDAGVRLVNPLRTIDVAWPALQAVETRWALTLVTTWGSYRAWAAPAPGRSVMRQQLRHHVSQDRRIPGLPPNSSARPSDLPHTDSGAAAQAINEHWKRLRAGGHLDHPVVEHDRPPVRWHWELVVLIAVPAAIGVLGLVL
jgi:hypothetical protein